MQFLPPGVSHVRPYLIPSRIHGLPMQPLPPGGMHRDDFRTLSRPGFIRNVLQLEILISQLQDGSGESITTFSASTDSDQQNEYKTFHNY